MCAENGRKKIMRNGEDMLDHTKRLNYLKMAKENRFVSMGVCRVWDNHRKYVFATP